MFQSKVLQKFIRSKLQDKLKTFFELDASTIEGFTIRNLVMKPDLLNELSQVIKIPLILISGSIESVSLNIPWESLLSTSKDNPIAVVLKGIKINAKLPDQLQRVYVITRKKKIVQKFTQQFNKKTTSRLTFLNKLREHFLGSICVEVSDLEIQINIQMKHSLIGTLSVSYLKFQKDIKTDKTKFQIRDLSLGYRLTKQTKQQYIINKADMVMTGEKSDGKDVKNLQTNNLQLSFNNQNFNDVRRIIQLIKWHNSFTNIPSQLWAMKPHIIGQVKPKKKLIYIANIIKYKTSQLKPKTIKKILQTRRKYIRLFQNFRKDPSNIGAKQLLNQQQSGMEVWRVQEYRQFCLLWAKKFPSKAHSNMDQKKEAIDKKINWLSYWFPKSEQNVLNELQNCLESTPAIMYKKYFTLTIQTIKIKLSIQSLAGKQPFLNLISIGNQFTNSSLPISVAEHQEIHYESTKKFTVNKMVIEFDKYSGHHEDHKYLMCEANNAILQSQDEFQDIQNFIQCQFTKYNTDIKIMPLRIRVNEDTLEKMSVFKFQRIHNTFHSAQTLVLQQNSFEQQQTKQQAKILNLRTSVYFTVPQNMFEKQCQQLEISLQDIHFTKQRNRESLKIQGIEVNASLLFRDRDSRSHNNQSNHHLQQSQSQVRTRQQTVRLIRTSLTMNKQIHNSIQKLNWHINFVKIQMSSMEHLKQLIRLASKLKPKPKNRKPLYKLRHLRRKQSIGQQFIDACENLQQHLIKSSAISQKTKIQRYIVKDKRDIQNIFQLEGLKIIFEASEIQLSKWTTKIFQFPDNKSITSDEEEKYIYIRIFNIKNSLRNINDISKQLERRLELKSKNEDFDMKKPEIQDNNDIFLLSQLNVFVEVLYDNESKILAQITDISMEINGKNNVKAQLKCGLAFNQYHIPKNNQKDNKKKDKKIIKQYVVEPFKIIYFHQKQYNKDEKHIKINELNLNIKPNLFIELGNLFDKLNTPEKLKIQIINSTSNVINVSTTGNIYKEYGPGSIAISQSHECDVIIFGKKESFSLLPASGSQKIKLTSSLNMIKTMQTQYIFHIQSNFRITNRQQKTIWIRVITSKAISQLRKNSMRQGGLVTFQHLSAAYMEQMDDQERVMTRKNTNLKRSTSLHAQVDDEINDKQDQKNQEEIKMKKATIVRMIGNPNLNAKMPDIYAEKDLIKAEKDKIHSNQVIYEVPSLKKPISHKSSSPQKLNILTSLSKYKSIQSTAYRPINKNQILFTQIAPQQTIQILLSSQDYYIQLIQYDKKGQILQKYHSFKVKQVLKDGNQKLVNSHLFESWEQQKQISSSLVIATNVLTDQKNTQNSIYNLEILSPVVMVNKMPVQIQFRLSKQEVDLLQVMNSAGKQIRKRSFQTVGLERIQPFKIDRINKTQYKQISQTQICVGQYYKNFRLDHIIQNLKEPVQNIDIRITDHLCLNNGSHEIQMGIQIRILKYVMKITIFPQFIFVNLTTLDMSLQIQQQNYNYPPIKMQPLKQAIYYKSFIKMSNQKLCNYKILQSLFKSYEQNINTFTGSFDQDTVRSVKYGDDWRFNASKIFKTYEVLQNKRGRQKIVNYGSKQNKMVVRKIKIDDKPIHLVLFMPSLFVINKSDWSFFIKVEGEKPKKLQKHSTEYILINDTIGVQACEEQEEIAFNQWMKITLNTLGTIYYAKQMTSSSGYESRQYELRKKRLKKAPKLFFRIVMTKYQYGHQILIEQSQYPPVTFISRCQSRVQIVELKQNIKQEMQMNEMAQYASKIPHHTPFFGLSMVENYQFFKLGQFSLQQPNGQKILRARVKVIIQQYKDKKIVIIQDYKHQNTLKNQSNIRNELLLQKLSRMFLLINNIQISIMTNSNKQLSCACIKNVELHHQTKNTKKYIKLSINDAQIISYNGLQPSHLFYCKQNTQIGISKAQVLNLFKKRPVNTNQPTRILPNSPQHHLSASISNMNSSLLNASSNESVSSAVTDRPVLILDLVIDYHKHATILQKCKVSLSPIVIVINANTLIDYLKFYYRQLVELLNMIKKHEIGRIIIREIKQAVNPSHTQHIGTENSANAGSSLVRRNSININYINNFKKANDHNNQTNPAAQVPNFNRQSSMALQHSSSIQSPSKHQKLQHRHSIQSANQSSSSNENDVDFLNRGFVIQNFSWQGLKITFKFQHLDNLQYFMNNKQIKYLIKFITWIGDLRPIQFSPTEVEYEQYTIMKLLQLIDVKKLIRELSQMFLQYPLQQFYNIMSFVTKFVGFNDIQDGGEQWQTLKKLGKSAFKVSKKIFSSSNTSPTYIVAADGQLKQNKQYLQQFMEENINNPDIVQKILRLKYEQWRYKQQVNQQKLTTKISRLQRYNLPFRLQPYQSHKARIQTALNDHCGNKIFRQITKCLQVNRQTLMGVTDDLFVLYFMEKEEWIVTKPEEVLDLRIWKTQNNNKNKLGMSLSSAANFSAKQLIITLSVETRKSKTQTSKIEKFCFDDLLINQNEVQSVQSYLKQLKLSTVY